MTARTKAHNLQVATSLYDFIEQQVLPAVGVKSDKFWKGFSDIVTDLAPKNAALLAERDRIQAEMDAWHTANPGPIQDMAAYRAFLEKIGYLVPVPADVQTTTSNVDAELATQAGPQLVVPILNARYALNAAAPLINASHRDAAGYAVEAGQLVVKLINGTFTSLANPAQLVGYQGE